MPSASSIAKLADRLDCSIDYLMGRSPQLQTPGVEQAPAPIQDNGPDLDEALQLSRNASEMLELFEQLPGREQVLFIGRLREAVSRTVGEGKNSGSSPVRAG